MTAGADINVFADDTPAEAGGTISGTFTVINTGNSVDVFSLSSVGLDCQMESSVTLQPGGSTLQLPYVCDIPGDALRNQCIQLQSSVNCPFGRHPQ